MRACVRACERDGRNCTDLGLEDLAVVAEGVVEGVVVGGPGEAADEAAVLNVRRRHLFRSPTNRNRNRNPGGEPHEPEPNRTEPEGEEKPTHL